MCGSMTRSFPGRWWRCGFIRQMLSEHSKELVPLVYLGVKVSYGMIQQMLVEAKGAARLGKGQSMG